jgi:hypothetical protein
MSLKEIAAISAERRAGRMTRDRSVAVLSGQLARLDSKAAELAAMKGYLRAKIAWLGGGEKGPAPDFEAFSKPARSAPLPLSLGVSGSAGRMERKHAVRAG